MVADEPCVVVVLEHGADWPAFVSSCCTEVPELSVIAQGESEAGPELVERVRFRVALLRRSHRRPAVVVLATSRFGGSSARALLVAVLLDALTAQATVAGRLILVAPHGALLAGRRDLYDLADQITRQRGSPRLTLTLTTAGQVELAATELTVADRGPILNRPTLVRDAVRLAV